MIYLLTIHKHQVKDYVTTSDLDSIVSELKAKLHMNIIDYSYEIGSSHRELHSHLIVNVKGRFRYKDYTKINGFQAYWDKAYEIDRLRSYIHKDSSNVYEQEEIIIRNYYNHHYGFI